MSVRTVAVPRTRRYEPATSSAAPSPPRALILSALLVAALGGMAAQWLDFRALRVPLLLMMGFGVLATAYAATAAQSGRRRFLSAVLIGIGTWAAVEAIYAVIHVASGERFHASFFGPQPAQAAGLIAAHGLFLGAPTGVVAGAILQLAALRRRRDGA